ncbi:MAG: UDP-N-acetylmuramoyl-L-alanyl-D-glutamate--2,6-diaminopimelate ligase [Actinobacteria bacterium]|nr:UDP-N-acetylmuramoyl-L-alanyl-D-glutamate--2,6-diaminopimelate ligase [Actinomycetota bacterium]
MRLAEVLRDAGGAPIADVPPILDESVANLDIVGIALSSDGVEPGFAFAALPGHHRHGAEFIDEACRRGAVAVITDSQGQSIIARSAHSDVPIIVHDRPRPLVAHIAAVLAGFPTRSLTMVGVTGTNGKTSVGALLAAALDAGDISCGVIGTLGSTLNGDQLASGPRTTPEAPDIQAMARSMVDRGAEAIVMEVSSIALSEHRVDGVVFDVAVFTGLSHDHLDYHATMEAYFAAKAELFTKERSRRGVVLIDDEWGERLARESAIPLETVSTTGKAANWNMTAVDDGWVLTDGVDSCDVRTPVGADFVVANAAVAIVAALRVGVPLDVAADATETARIPGRMELVGRENGIDYIVDYAHTPDAIEQVVSAAARERAARGQGRVVVVIGAGGDRDPQKRPDMGTAASRADVVIVTDDNPRSENPADIRRQILEGVQGGCEIHECDSRRDAIGLAVATARPGDVVLVLGKGHEATQERAEGLLAFDDRQVLAFFVGRRFGGGSREGVT